MTRGETFTLTTAELQTAIANYITSITGKVYDIGNIEGFSVNQSRDDIREYTTYVGFKEEVSK